jgi:hypothetical protein
MGLIRILLVFMGYLLADITILLAIIGEKGANPQNEYDSKLNLNPGVKTGVNLKRVSMRLLVPSSPYPMLLALYFKNRGAF